MKNKMVSDASSCKATFVYCAKSSDSFYLGTMSDEPLVIFSAMYTKMSLPSLKAASFTDKLYKDKNTATTASETRIPSQELPGKGLISPNHAGNGLGLELKKQ